MAVFIETRAEAARLEAETRREKERRHAFARMLQATDDALDWLEGLNLVGVERVSVKDWGELYESLSELPSSCLEVLADPGKVQRLLDSVFEVQERLFRWRDPRRVVERDPEVVA